MGASSRRIPDRGFLLLLAAIFLFGGSSRADILSVIPLRLIACVGMAFALADFPKAVWRDNRALISLAFGWILLTAIQLVPLPPALWQSLPGHELATAIDQAAGLEGTWRPISLVPWRTVNALLALTVPLAVLLFMLAQPVERAKHVVYLLLLMVAASAVLGLLQVIGGAGNPFYTYRVTNPGSAVGLFANRNHNAVFLSLGFPLLAAALSLWRGPAELVRTREWAGAGVAVLLIPFILTTQSRAGLVVAALCMALALWIYQTPAGEAQKRRIKARLNPRMVFGALAACGIIAVTTVFTATSAIERLIRIGRDDNELRMQIWGPIAKMAGEYFPVGSGFGTFVEVYQADEPGELLQPSYINHAHNDWLEVMLTGSVPAMALLAFAVFVLLTRGMANQAVAKGPTDIVMRRLGLSICAILALASLYDYPVRTPALAAVLAIGAALALRPSACFAR